MANNMIYSRIVIWSETKTDWGTIDTVLLKGEIGFEFPDTVEEGKTAVPKMKVGDGTHQYKDLPYAVMTPDEVSALVNKITVDKGAHTHVNKEILDRITEAFTTELKTKYDGVADEAVRGVTVGGTAYEKGEDGVVNLPAYPTKESLGLDKVSNEADADRTVGKADKFTTPRTISISGEATGSATFDGSADADIAVTIPSVDASKLTGTIDIARLPKGALERCVVVNNDTARFALTKDTVQTGDTVKVTDTGKMYFVLDDSKLNVEAGYEFYTAGSATSVPWAGVTDKPSTFTPSEHTHTMADITDYVEPTVDKELSTSSTNAVENKAIATKFEDIDAKIADLMYTAINITSFSNTVNVAEMGATVDNVTLNWDYNKVPKTLTLDGVSVTPKDKSKALTAQGIKTNKSFTLRAVDERNATSTKTTSITFYNGIYYGAKTAVADIDSAFILGLTKKLQGSKATTFSANANGADSYIYYAVPTRYGTCGFNVGGFDGGFSKVSTIEFTNASGYKESYDVYKSDNANLGQTTVKVS